MCYHFVMTGHYERKRERIRDSQEQRDYVSARYTAEQQRAIEDISYGIATQILQQAELTGIKDPEMDRVIKYACEYYISGFETVFDNLLKQFEHFNVEATGERKDLLREALEMADIYRVQFEEIANSTEQEMESAGYKAKEETESSESENSLVASVSLPKVGGEDRRVQKTKGIKERWDEAEEKAKAETAQRAAAVAVSQNRSIRERWEEGSQRQLEGNEERSKYLER